jgi:hypothetical protein
MFLGFGIGRFGTSRGRLRLKFKPPTREAAEKGILGRGEVLELEDSSLQSLAACHEESLMPNPTVLRSREEADDALTEAGEAYARFEDIKGKLHRFIYEEADAMVSEAMGKDEPVETGLLRMMSREDGLVESESAGEDSMQSLGKTVAEDRDNEHIEIGVENVAVAESAKERSTAPKGTGTGTGKRELKRRVLNSCLRRDGD